MVLCSWPTHHRWLNRLVAAINKRCSEFHQTGRRHRGSCWSNSETEWMSARVWKEQHAGTYLDKLASTNSPTRFQSLTNTEVCWWLLLYPVLVLVIIRFFLFKCVLRFNFSVLIKAICISMRSSSFSLLPYFFLFLLPVTDEDTVKRYYAKFEERFFQTCEKELLKINTFYSGAQPFSSFSGPIRIVEGTGECNVV